MKGTFCISSSLKKSFKIELHPQETDLFSGYLMSVMVFLIFGDTVDWLVWLNINVENVKMRYIRICKE